MSSTETLIRDRLPAQPAGFKVKALSCNYCGDKDRVNTDSVSYDAVLAWITKHEKCEERKLIEAANVQVPS